MAVRLGVAPGNIGPIGNPAGEEPATGGYRRRFGFGIVKLAARLADRRARQGPDSLLLIEDHLALRTIYRS